MNISTLKFNTTKFVVGDIVSLKSGSPLMTVRCSPANNTVLVDWFAADEHYTATFYKDQLIFPEIFEEEDNPDNSD